MNGDLKTIAKSILGEDCYLTHKGNIKRRGEKYSYKVIICKFCNKIKLTRSDIDQQYCSISCQSRDSWKVGKIKAMKHGGLIRIKCKYCGIEFEDFRSNDKKFCNLDCLNKYYNNKRLNRTCKNCGKTFSIAPSILKTNATGNYCGLDCYIDSGRKTLNCQYCNKVFSSKKHRKDKYCSQECAQKANSGENHYKWLGGGEKYYGINWNRQRKRARERDNFVCQKCGINEDELDKELDVHHIISFRKFGLKRYLEANELSNLVSLCPSCHMSIGLWNRPSDFIDRLRREGKYPNKIERQGVFAF